MNGKEIIIQRLRNTTQIKKLRFLEQEASGKIFDFASSRYDLYRKDDQLIFEKIKKTHIVDQLQKSIKPKWMLDHVFKKIVNTTNQMKKTELIDDAVNSYDRRTEKYFNELLNFDIKQNQVKIEKGQNVLFNVEFLICGKLSSGEEYRFPFALREITQLKIDRVKRAVKIIKSNDYLPNVPFISWLGNKNNIATETYLNDLDDLHEDNYILDQLLIYSKLGIKLEEENFSNLDLMPLQIRKENKSGKTDLETALHESRHLILALIYNHDCENININNQSDGALGSLSLYNDENDFKELFDVLIAPYVFDSSFSQEDFSMKVFSNINDYRSDYKKINEILCDNFSSDSEREEFAKKRIASVKNILIKNESKIELFTKYLLKQKVMNGDQIYDQFNSEQLIESYNNPVNEIKFEKGSLWVEKVNLIAVYEEIIDQDILKEVNKIFDTTFIDDFLYHNNDTTIESKKNQCFNESLIHWGFHADINQQLAVYQTTKFNNVVIQGPPGTGKTQTILNIISENLALGNKILIVSEKITAVDVIKKRIEKESKHLSNLVLNLFNIESEKIKFFNEIGLKLKNMLEFRSNVNSFPEFTDLTPDENKLEKIAKKIDDFSFDRKYDKWAEFIPNAKDLRVYNSMDKDRIDVTFNLNSKNYAEFSEWKTTKDRLIDFKNKNFNPNIQMEIIKKIVQLNTTTPYSDSTCYKYASIIDTGSEKVSIFKRGKFRKIAERMNLSNVFLNDFSLLLEYCKFNFDKYSDNDIHSYVEYKKIIDNKVDIESIRKIHEYSLDLNNLDKIKDQMNIEEICDFDDINDKEKFDIVHEFNFKQHCQKVQKYFPYNSQSANTARRYLLGLIDRKRLTEKTKWIFRNYWDYLHKAFPIVLTTPEILSKYIPLSRDIYDVVIIDEASQFLIEKAIPSLYRGAKKIISGDKMQLRPNIESPRISSDFQDDSEIKYNELIVNESILDLFDSLFKESQVMLKIHYRSDKKELIQFSNDTFYNGELKFLEHVEKINSANPITVIDVKGEWKDQVNEIEAKAIIRILKELFEKRKKASVGVIVFSKKQANTIKKILYKDEKNDDVMNSLLTGDPDSLFIKSIDQVQGEERDIIIFGITYGNKVPNYGLLNGNWAQNRINVASTRAKQKMIIVKSHLAKEYRRPIVSNSEGPKTLFNFLDYVENIQTKKSKNFIQGFVDQKDMFHKYLQKNGIVFDNLIEIVKKSFYIQNKKNGEHYAYFVVDSDVITNPRENLFFYLKILKEKGYIPMPISITSIYDFNNK